MSIDALNWAFSQPKRFRDMKPNEQAVLIQLADCHNYDRGCFPSQQYIVERTNLSERSVRDQLDRLRDRGLISWDALHGSGKRLANRYSFAFEAGFQAANPADYQSGDAADDDGQPANSAGDQPANSDTPTGKFQQTNRQISPLHKEEPELEPQENHLREARTSDDEGDEPSEDVRSIERGFRRLTKNWPGFGGMPKEKAERAWFELTADERAEAERKFPGWLALLKAQHKRHTPGPEAYFRGKLWQDVAEPDSPAASRFVQAKPFGPDWAAARMASLLRGPTVTEPTLTRFEMTAIERGMLRRDVVMADKLRSHGWPDVNAMHERADQRKEVSIPREAAAPEGAMEPVPVSSEVFEAWRRLHDEQGWPWVPDPGVLPVVWFPVGGPDGLSAFEARMQAGQGGDHARD